MIGFARVQHYPTDSASNGKFSTNQNGGDHAGRGMHYVGGRTFTGPGGIAKAFEDADG